MTHVGKILVFLGLALTILGLLFIFGDRLGLGRLPGDLVWRRRNVTIHVPIVTSILVSLVLTILLNLFLRRK